jgi:hypothetical protein
MESNTDRQRRILMHNIQMVQPPLPCKKFTLGTIDLGLLGDPYICAVNSKNQTQWLLMPECLKYQVERKLLINMEAQKKYIMPK